MIYGPDRDVSLYIKRRSCVRPVDDDHVYQSARLIDNNSALFNVSIPG